MVTSDAVTCTYSRHDSNCVHRSACFGVAVPQYYISHKPHFGPIGSVVLTFQLQILSIKIRTGHSQLFTSFLPSSNDWTMMAVAGVLGCCCWCGVANKVLGCNLHTSGDCRLKFSHYIIMSATCGERGEIGIDSCRPG